MDKPSHWFTFF